MLRPVTPPNATDTTAGGRPLPAGCVALRKAIVRLGLTQAKAAERMRVPERTLRRWLAGGSEPTLSAYLRLVGQDRQELEAA